MNETCNDPFMAEEDLLYTILADLKRTSREYTTGVTEAACPVVRQMFTNLMNSTLTLQDQLFTLMEQRNMYSVSSPAQRQEINKQLQDNQQVQTKGNQFVQQKLGHVNQHQHDGYSSGHHYHPQGHH